MIVTDGLVLSYVTVLSVLVDAVFPFTPSVATLAAIVAITVPEVPRVVRLVRSIVLSVREEPYVEAAISVGTPLPRLLWRHVLPNIIAPIVVFASLYMANAILLEAALSFLGLGVQPPQPSWGRMLSEAQTLLFQAPRLAVFPGIAIALAVLGLNLLGDGLRDLFDPRLARKR